MTIGYHASHEQFPPATLLGLALRAEQAGFEAVMCSDHFHPWTTAQGQSGHSWVWAGALAVQSALTLGMVTCPMLRQHPALVAQAAATLEQLAPGRIWLALGTGEALNERITGQPWPAMPDTLQALAGEAAHQAGFDAFEPDACLINHYAPGTRLSLHQDRDEQDFSQPIVSVSLGMPATFLFGGLTRSERPARVALWHGDVVVWGGVDRLRFHGVAPIKGDAHPLLGLGRINLTFRRAGPALTPPAAHTPRRTAPP